MEPTIVCPWDFKGAHNEGIKTAEKKLQTKMLYQDLSVVAVTPTRNTQQGPSPRWIAAMLSIMKPMNQRFTGPVFFCGMEVGDAYNTAVRTIFEHKDLKNYRFMLTWEDDVIPQPDALLEMLAVQAETGADIVSSMYWSKGEDGFPMIYGDITDPEVNFRPIYPTKDKYQWCYGSGMGFTLFDLNQFREHPGEDWFKTNTEYDSKERTIRQATQDLYYMETAIKRGYKICVAQQAKCAHYDSKGDVLW